MLLRKQKLYEGIKKPHFNKNFRKQIMIRSRLKNKANKSKNPIDIAKFKRERNQMLIVIKNQFGKHVNRTSHIKIAIYKKI